MKDNRRAFVKKIGSFGLASLLPWISLNAESRNKIGRLASGEIDEDYWRLVRSHFHIKKGYHYFNNGTMGPSPFEVEEAVIEKTKSVNFNLNYKGGEGVREKIAQLINGNKDEISLTHNTTEGINVIAWGLPLKKGEEIILTSHEHVGNAMPWLNRAKHDGLVVKTFVPPKGKQSILDAIQKLITKKTRVVTVPHISCTIGQRFPVKEINEIAKSKNIYFVIDGAHGAGTLHLDMKELDADAYITCGHKWLLGPKGTGFIHVPKRNFDVIKPIFAGAYTDTGFDISTSPASFTGYNPTAHRYDYGTQNPALRMGLESTMDFHLRIGSQVIQNRIFDLNGHLRKALVNLDHIEILSPMEQGSESGMLGIRHRNMEYKSVASMLAKQGFRIRQVPEAGLNSLRISTHIYNSYEEIDQLIDILKKNEK